MRNRSMAFVIKGKKILFEKLIYKNRTFYSIPGGGIEQGETPEEAALRELKEECGLEGTIVKKLTKLYKSDGSKEYVFQVNVSDDQSAVVGFDPEEPKNNQPIKDVCWITLEQMSERDRAFMWAYGLMEIEGFFDEIVSWGDAVSYPSQN